MTLKRKSSPPSMPVSPKKPKTPTKALTPKSTPTKTKVESDSADKEDVTAHEDKPAGSPKKGTALSPSARAEIMDEIITAGYKSINLDDLAQRYGSTRSQLVDQFKPNRANMRSAVRKFFETGASGGK